jgi:hypothetical protein
MASEYRRTSLFRSVRLVAAAVMLLIGSSLSFGLEVSLILSMFGLFIVAIAAAGQLDSAPLPGVVLALAIPFFVISYVDYGLYVGPVLLLVDSLAVAVTAMVRSRRPPRSNEHAALRLSQLLGGIAVIAFACLGVAQIYEAPTEYNYSGGLVYHSEYSRIAALAPTPAGRGVPVTLGVFWNYDGHLGPSLDRTGPDRIVDLLTGRFSADPHLPKIEVSGPDGPVPVVAARFRDSDLRGYFRAAPGAVYAVTAGSGTFAVQAVTFNKQGWIGSAFWHCAPVAAVGIIMLLSSRRRPGMAPYRHLPEDTQ